VAALAADTGALVFIGFMGAGKSSAARIAGESGLEAVDTDLLLADELGMPIPEFFAREGEEEFRRREEEITVAALERGDGAIALGGGAVLSERVRAALGRHLVVWLDISAADAWDRVGGSEKRPLAADRDEFERLYAERRPLYSELADAVVVSPSREVLARAMPALVAAREVRVARLLWAASASGDYPVWVGPGILGEAPWPVSGRRFCVTDTTVARLHRDRVAPVEHVIELEPGEKAKTMAEAERVLRALAEAGMTRSDHLVALGGGVVGDLTGFCAATYQRGVPVVQVPTTLLAQVDSAYGGKTGVDLPEAKNYVGAYHLPAGVLADTAMLATLPAEEMAAGYVEVLKTGLLAGGSAWERVQGLGRLDAGRLAGVVFDCALTKSEVVAADERDAGRRQILNLGHTVGHAIEAATSYRRYRHGEAVGLGLLAALRLSGADDLRGTVRDLLAQRGLPVRLDQEVGIDSVLESVERDKKRTSEGVEFVLLARPGEPLTGQRVDPGSLRAAVEELQ
jgi:shikimate kinase / 3-dehydroquinate synthase